MAETPQGSAVDAAAAEASAAAAQQAAAAAIADAAHVAAEAERAAAEETARIAAAAGAAIEQQNERVNTLWQNAEQTASFQNQTVSQIQSLQADSQSLRETVTGMATAFQSLAERLTPTLDENPPSADPVDRPDPEKENKPLVRKRRFL